VEGESSEPAAAGAGQGVDPAGVAIALDAAAQNARVSMALLRRCDMTGRARIAGSRSLPRAHLMFPMTTPTGA